MPQPKKGPRLGSDPSHQRQMMSNLASSLFEHERVKTTEAKAKLLRPYAERLITKAKRGTVHTRRQVLSALGDREIVHKLFAEIAPRFDGRNGGYTRIMKLGPRNGDGAPMALIELVESASGGGDGDASAETGGRRRRLRRPLRRGGSGDLPQDKPARPQAADAAAAGAGAGADVKPPPGAAEESAAAQIGGESASAQAHHEAAHGQAGADPSGKPPQVRETRSAEESKQD